MLFLNGFVNSPYFTYAVGYGLVQIGGEWLVVICSLLWAPEYMTTVKTMQKFGYACTLWHLQCKVLLTT